MVLASFFCLMGAAAVLVVTAVAIEPGARGRVVASMAYGGVALAVLAISLAGALLAQ